jgi:hypothetical protein
MEELNTERQVCFLGRHKKYGKWKKYTVTISKELEKSELRNVCINFIKEQNDSEYAEILHFIT